jgi:YVTN family beta-propeller protein
MNSKRTHTIAAGCVLASFVTAGFCSGDPMSSMAPPGVIFELLALNRDLPTKANPKYLSTMEMIASPDSQTLYVSEKNAKQIGVIDLTAKTLKKNIKLPNDVTGIAVAPDGKKIYATCASDLWPAGMVCEVDPNEGKVLRRIAVGHSARAPVMNPDGKTLYVCNLFDNNVSVVDLASGAETKRIPVIREPYSAAITPDGSVLVVANSLPNDKSTDTVFVTCHVSLISTAEQKVTADVPLTRGSHSAFGMAVSPDGKYAFITHLVAMFTIPALLIEGGWIHTNNLGIIDIKGKKLLNDVCLDKATAGSANPWGIACTKDGSTIAIAHSGSNDLSVLPLDQMITKASVSQPLNQNFSALYSIRQKVPVVGKAPRALAIIGNTIYTAGYFSDTLEMFDITPSEGPDLMPEVAASGTIALGPPIPMTSKRAGEYRYFDASLCLQKWQSCHSCHPFTRPDALNWTLNAPNSTPKNALSMLYSWWTPPTSWAGKRRDAYESVRAGIRAELFQEPDERMAVCIDTFFMSLKPVPSPYLVKGDLSAAARRGREIYYNKSKVDCIICHPGPLFTDNQFHNTGVPDQWDNLRDWNSPTVVECWRTGPYGHLGSFDDLGELLKLRTHSNSANLSASEFNDLLEYVLSL